MALKETLLSKLMNEPVEMVGFPQIIVSRGWMYQWLKGLGWNESDRGYSSLDYTVFARSKVEEPLTSPEDRDALLAPLKQDYSR